MWPVPCAPILKWIVDLLPRDCALWDYQTSMPIFDYIYQIPMSMWGFTEGYWWPVLGIIGLGVLICVVASSYSNHNIKPMKFNQTTIYWLFVIIKWSLYGVIGFHCIVWFLIGLLYFFNNPDLYSYGLGAMVLIALLCFGIWFANQLYVVKETPEDNKKRRLEEQAARERRMEIQEIQRKRIERKTNKKIRKKTPKGN